MILRKEQVLFNPLPAVAIGGPPHSGKSVLAYSLTYALREHKVLHYLLRAAPMDGEGDWFHEGPQELVRILRVKGARSESWLPLLRRDIAHRHLPLLVDMGGLPTLEQETILDECTHAILLTPDEESRREWEDRFARHGLVLLADLRSDLHGENQLEQVEPVLIGTLAGLERGRRAEGPAFEALVARLVRLFRAASTDLRRRHLEQAPAELVVDLDLLARRMKRSADRWYPEDLPQVLAYLPPRKPLALYGRGPNWLYAAVAAHTAPSSFYLFDVRLGWIETPALRIGIPPSGSPLVASVRPLGEVSLVEFSLPDAYLNIDEIETLRVPPPPQKGLILSGRLPHWLWAALARVYDAPWIAVLQPQLHGAVVVRSRRVSPPVGTVVPLPFFPHSP
ncbi:MAG TPA: hypothetical protein EYH27_04815 [Anaerolineales bacterium]|nr:hypothetical protein [Anaerolineae bacterium]HIP87742.1 hypothetical protein [Anaerolineales bacterium]